ncbi:tRNA (N6-threonylcarbamoyladenosine(37)-N6)-methyltransferase TrmO [Pendulispora albinea]|uniref:tRNA (N6-threonylcarbamoyladenosine(37)-N6)-methyltransferase TrmO n=1 Tax=Pendulispora albinea TaxID=2741071 RepID=A0ABZ2LSS1_9BACT
MSAPLSVSPIGVVRTPFKEKVSAPRQAVTARDVPGTIELLPEYEHALSDLEGIDRIWVLWWFHLAEGWRAKVLPPRSEHRRGLFATRSPHRPNPIALSCVRLVRVSGLTLHILDVDMVDGTPVLDIKPYVPYADAFPEAHTGWLEKARDPAPGHTVTWSEEARAQAGWLAETYGLELMAPIEAILSLGPQPHPYRRIKKLPGDGAGLCLAYKDWRVLFRAEGERTIAVDALATGYRQNQLFGAARVRFEHDPESLAVHRAFVIRFPPRRDPEPTGDPT